MNDTASDSAHSSSSAAARPDAAQAAPVVEMRQVNKWYGNYQALHAIDLQVARGERIVLCGPSGSGKSTLIRCVNQLERIDQGHLAVLGADLGQASPAATQALRKVGMVFQHFNLFPHMSVLDNCTLALRSVKKLGKQAAAECALHYLDQVGIANQAAKYPTQLSGGQQQRVAIARAICLEPEIMLFDEPTAALDPEMVKEVLEVMVRLAQTGMTMLCVTHEMGFARRVAERILFLDEGHLLEDTAPGEFFDSPRTERAQTFLRQIL